MKTRQLCSTLALGALLTAASLIPTRSAAAPITYQGRVLENGSPVAGEFRLKVHLYDAAEGGTRLFPSDSNAFQEVTATEGLFSITIDVTDSLLNGQALWAETLVEFEEGSGFTGLEPRHRLSSAPYAVHATTAVSAGTADQANTAAFATSAGSADTADHATIADVADYADYAERLELPVPQNGISPSLQIAVPMKTSYGGNPLYAVPVPELIYRPGQPADIALGNVRISSSWHFANGTHIPQFAIGYLSDPDDLDEQPAANFYALTQHESGITVLSGPASVQVQSATQGTHIVFLDRSMKAYPRPYPPNTDPQAAQLFTMTAGPTKELYAMDSSGNWSLLSSHADPIRAGAVGPTSFSDASVTLPYSILHANALLGRQEIIDLTKLVHWAEGKMVAELGEDGRLVHGIDLPEDQRTTLDDYVAGIAYEAAVADLAANGWEDTGLTAGDPLPKDAVVEVDRVYQVLATAEQEYFEVDWETGTLVSRTRTVPTVSTAATGMKTKALSKDYRLEGNRLLRRRQLEDIDPTQLTGETVTLPDWIVLRLQDDAARGSLARASHQGGATTIPIDAAMKTRVAQRYAARVAREKAAKEGSTEQ